MHDESRLTLDSLTKPSEIPYIGMETSDFWIVASPLVFGIALTSIFELGLLGLAFAVIPMLLGLLLLYVTPDYVSTKQWLHILWRFRQSPKRSSALGATDHRAEGFFDRTQAAESSRPYSLVEEYLPKEDIIKRTDGRFVAALELAPPNRDFAERSDWIEATETCAAFAKNALDFDIQLYLTTRPFPIEDYIDRIENEIATAENMENSIVEAIVTETIEERPIQLRESGTAPVHFYLILDVGPEDVVISSHDDLGPLAKLAKLPILGIPFQLLVSYQEGLTAARRDARMIKKLTTRKRAIEQELVQEMDDFTCRDLSLAEWLLLLEEFWQGEQPPTGDKQTAVRTQAAVGGPGEESEPESNAPSSETGTDATMASVDSSESSSEGPAPDREHTVTEPNSRIGGVIATLRRFGSAPEAEELTSAATEELAPPAETKSMATDTSGEGLPSLADIQQRQLAPASIERGYRHLKTGSTHRQILFADQWPDTVPHNILSRILMEPDLQFDLSLHIAPRDRQRAIADAEERIQSLNADAATTGDGVGGGDLAAGDKRSEAQTTRLIRDQLKHGQRPFEISLYVGARHQRLSAADQPDLADEVEKLRNVFRDAPANLGLKTVAGEQLRALQSIAPLGKNVLQDETPVTPEQIVLSRGVGAILGSLTKSKLAEESGIEMGEHAFNGSPIIKDPFNSKTSYNWVVIGDSGSGKSYAGKEMALRTKIFKPDTQLIFLDPMRGFEGLAKALDAKTITVGSDLNMNPLEIRPPSETEGTAAPNTDPLSQKIGSLMDLFSTYAKQEAADFDDARMLLYTAFMDAYERRGITHDPRTHHRQSPTMQDVLDVLDEMTTTPSQYVVRSESEEADIRAHAATLLNYFRPFQQGIYENLTQRSEFDIRDEEVVYIDLHQSEGSSEGPNGFLLQLIISLVYERAKESPKDVIFIIDEAQFLMRDAASLEFFGQRVRHARHYDLSIRFLTQNIDDFFSENQAEAESIYNNSFVKMFHKTTEITQPQWREFFELNDAQVRFISNAQTGSDGYSEALTNINGTWFPLQIFANRAEDAVIDYDPRTDYGDGLPGNGSRMDSPIHEQQVEGNTARDEIEETQQSLDFISASGFELHGHLELLSISELHRAMKAIHDGHHPTVALDEAVASKIDRLLRGVQPVRRRPPFNPKILRSAATASTFTGASDD